jgi:4-oxalocrotonate tautomerase
MAYVTVQISKGNSIERKRKLVKAVTDALVYTLDTKSESIIVHIEEIEREDWAVGGVLQYDKNTSKREDRDDRDDKDDRNDRKNR